VPHSVGPTVCSTWAARLTKAGQAQHWQTVRRRHLSLAFSFYSVCGSMSELQGMLCLCLICLRVLRCLHLASVVGHERAQGIAFSILLKG
jgi:hypothetical protein